MSFNNFLKIYRFDFISSNFYNQKSKAAKFSGYIDLSFDGNIIVNKKFHFNYCEIDLLTTKSWFSKKTSLFKRRKALLNKLLDNKNNYFQKIRNTKEDHDLIKLNDDQLIKLNNFINQEESKFTIKSISGLLRGSNPSGSYSRPNSAEMIWDNKSFSKFDYLKWNMVMFLDDITSEINNDDNHYVESSIVESISEWINIIENKRNSFHNYFAYLNKLNDFSKNHHFDYQIEKDFKNFSINLNQRTKAICIAKKQVKKRRLKIDKIEIEVFAKRKFQQKCHIFSIEFINREIEQTYDQFYFTNLFNENGHDNIQIFKSKIDELISYCDNKNNLLNIEPTIHKYYDENLFYYQTNGKIYFNKINEIPNENLEIINKYYSLIDQSKLNEEMSFFINKRNQWYENLK